MQIPSIPRARWNMQPSDATAYNAVVPRMDVLSPSVRAAEDDATSRHWQTTADRILGVEFFRLPTDWWSGWTAGARGRLSFILPLRGGKTQVGTVLSPYGISLPKEDLLFKEGAASVVHQRADKIGAPMFDSIDFRALGSDGRIWTARVTGRRL